VTSSGTVLDGATGLGRHVGQAAAPRRPGLSVEDVDRFEGRTRTRTDREVDASEHAFTQWQEAAEEAATRAVQRCSAHPSSITAAARAAQMAHAAGMQDEAIRAAESALDLLARHESEPFPLNASSAYIAILVLVNAGQEGSARDWLRRLPQNATLDVVHATLLVDERAFQEAFELIARSQLASAATLRGFVRLQQGRHAEAIAELRSAVYTQGDNADALVFMSQAYAALGSVKKARTFAQRAALVAPGRKDVSLFLIHGLAAERDFDAAEAEIRRVRDRGVMETPELLIAEARVAGGRGKVRQAVALLRRARADFREEEAPDLAAELEANILLLRVRLNLDPPLPFLTGLDGA